MANAARTQTQLRVKGHYTTRAHVNDTYTVELYDGNFAVDAIDFPSSGATVSTAAGYPKTCEGARQQAQDQWL